MGFHVAVRSITVFHLLGTVTLCAGEKSSRYAAILWLGSNQLDHEVLRWGNPDGYCRFQRINYGAQDCRRGLMHTTVWCRTQRRCHRIVDALTRAMSGSRFRGGGMTGPDSMKSRYWVMAST